MIRHDADEHSGLAITVNYLPKCQTAKRDGDQQFERLGDFCLNYGIIRLKPFTKEGCRYAA